MGEGIPFDPKKFLRGLDKQAAAHGVTVGKEPTSVPSVDKKDFDDKLKEQAAAHGVTVGQEPTSVPPVDGGDWEKALDDVQDKAKK